MHCLGKLSIRALELLLTAVTEPVRAPLLLWLPQLAVIVACHMHPIKLLLELEDGALLLHDPLRLQHLLLLGRHATTGYTAV